MPSPYLAPPVNGQSQRTTRCVAKAKKYEPRPDTKLKYEWNDTMTAICNQAASTEERVCQRRLRGDARAPIRFLHPGPGQSDNI